MTLKYKIIKIYTSEDIHWHGKLLYNAIIEYIRSLKLASRCTIHRGIAGCFENGEIATQSILDFSYNLPLTIEIVLPTIELDTVISHLEEMVVDGIIAIESLDVYSYHSSRRLIPPQIRVKEVMTTSPKTVTPASSVNTIISIMVDNSLKGVPVVDSNQHPIGIITSKDLIAKAGMPIRIGLLKRLDPGKINSFLKSIDGKTAKDIMSFPLVTVKEEQTIKEAVQIMIKQRVKRLPVINDAGVLVGIFSRIDVFQAITKHVPKWDSLQEQNVVVNNGQPVKTVLQRDLETVHPDTPITEIIEKITNEEIQRIAVVDINGKFVGLISDGDLLSVISGQPGFWELLKSKLTFTNNGRQLNELFKHARAKIAADIMITDITTIKDETTIDEAVKLMTEKGLKRVPVVDSKGIFKGMISRDSVLQAVIK